MLKIKKLFCKINNRHKIPHRCLTWSLISLKNIGCLCIFFMLKKCPYSEFLLSVFSRIWIDYGDIQSKCEKIWTRKFPNTDTFYAMLNKVQRCFLNVNAWEEYFYSKLDPLLNIFKSFSDGYIQVTTWNSTKICIWKLHSLQCFLSNYFFTYGKISFKFIPRTF